MGAATAAGVVKACADDEINPNGGFGLPIARGIGSARAGEKLLNWSWKSKPAFQHTFPPERSHRARNACNAHPERRNGQFYHRVPNPMKELTLAILHDQPLDPCSCGQEYDPDLDNITSVLTDICEALDASGAIRFVAGGFGQERWPVDVLTDLAVVVEQLPGVIDAVTDAAPASLDFFEQGIQRALRIEPAGAAMVRVVCESMTSWRPVPPVLMLARIDLVSTLTTLLQQFMRSARQRCPALAGHPWVSQWLGKYQRVGAVEDYGA